jgi:DNA polymerase-3 subunit beta
MSKQQTTSDTPAQVATTVDKAAFAAELEWIARFIERKSTIPILMNALLVKAGSTLTLTATDLEIAGTTHIDASELGADFRVTVPVRKLLKYLPEVAEDFVHLSVSENNILTLTHGSDSIVEIHGMSAEAYPELPKPVLEGTLSGLRLAVPRAIVAVSAEESRFTLNGAMLEVRDGARIVATDGHRLSLSDVVSTDIKPCRKLVPIGALRELAALSEDSFHFGYDENHLFFMSHLSVRRITARHLTGKFPDYERVLPKDFKFSATVESSALTKAVKRVIIFADERSRACSFELRDDLLEVEARMVEDGGAKARIKSDWYGEPFRIGLNGKYALDFLGLCPPGDFAFKTNAPEQACEFDTPGWRYVLMPMRI